jgi:hypothetical protein
MAKGWIVKITYCEAGIEFEQRFDVAISDRDEALAAARRLVGPATRIQ